MNPILQALEARAAATSAVAIDVRDVAAARTALAAPATLMCAVFAPPMAPAAGMGAALLDLERLAVTGAEEGRPATRSIDMLRIDLAARRPLVCFVATPSLEPHAPMAARVA